MVGYESRVNVDNTYRLGRQTKGEEAENAHDYCRAHTLTIISWHDHQITSKRSQASLVNLYWMNHQQSKTL